MSEKNITFEDLPKAMSWMMDKLNELDSKIDGLNTQSPSLPTDQWMNLKELCDYIPSHPAEQTVYGWTSCHQIPCSLNQRLMRGFEMAKLSPKKTWKMKLPDS